MIFRCAVSAAMIVVEPRKSSRLHKYLSPGERMLALVALGVAAQQHETRRRRPSGGHRHPRAVR